MKNINKNKGSGYDNIRPKDLKNNYEILTPSITKLVNLCLQEGKICKDLKTSIIRPIFKNGCKSLCSNYRPISILPAIDKIVEEVLVTRITNFIKKFKIIDDRQ